MRELGERLVLARAWIGTLCAVGGRGDRRLGLLLLRRRPVGQRRQLNGFVLWVVARGRAWLAVCIFLACQPAVQAGQQCLHLENFSCILHPRAGIDQLRRYSSLLQTSRPKAGRRGDSDNGEQDGYETNGDSRKIGWMDPRPGRSRPAPFPRRCLQALLTRTTIPNTACALCLPANPSVIPRQNLRMNQRQ